MKRSIIFLICCCWIALAIGAQAQTPANETQQQAAINRQLMAEVKSLRRELLQQAIEFQQWKLQHVTRELQQAQSEQQRLAGEEQLLQIELNELAVSSNGNGELETLKADLVPRSQRLRGRQQPANDRVSELSEQFAKEEKRLRQLTDQLKAETAKATR